MTVDQIREWALSHGFTAETSTLLKATYRDATVSLEMLPTAVRVKLSDPDGELKIGTFRTGGDTIHINEHDVIEGIGLSLSFRDFIGEDGPKPPWMPDEYFAAAFGRETSLPSP
jgi:hypothetical protein